MPKNSDLVIVGLALVALVVILLLWPRCGRQSPQQLGESSLAAAGAEVACMNCLNDYDGRISSTLLDRLTMSTGDLVARRAWPGRVGLEKWRRRQEKQDFYRWLNKRCPTGIMDYPGIVIQAEPLQSDMFSGRGCQSCGPVQGF